MGSKPSSSTTTINQSSTSSLSPNQEALAGLAYQRESALDPMIRDVQSQGLNLAGLLLRGQDLPGYLGGLPAGIDESTTQSIVNKALSDQAPMFQGSGLLDSGVRASIGARTAGDIRTQVAQFNIQNLMQLLNQALGGQAQVQQPILGFSQNAGNILSNPANRSSSGTQTTTQSGGPNPFLQAVGTGLGTFGALGGFCWVAAEIYGGWFHPKTINARRFFAFKAPRWMTNLYIQHGENVAKFISDKPIIKAMIKPLFDLFARLGEE